METKFEAQNVPVHRRRPRFMYFLAGVGCGAALAVFFAPESGEKTLKWVANKAFDAVDDANAKVSQARAQVKEMMDRRQQQVTQAVEAGREIIGVSKVKAPTPVSVKVAAG